METKDIAELKFRPLKKQMQRTFRHIQMAIQTDTIPDKVDVLDFINQISIMVSYPGFGDAAYHEIVAMGGILAKCAARNDLNGLKQILLQIMSLQNQCHEGPR